MIMKYRSDSLKLMGIEAAIRRLPPQHPRLEYLQGLQRQIISGIKGEDSLIKLFERVKFRFEYYVINDLQLYSTANFQIDSLFITPYYAIILEMKNIGGHIKIRKNHPQLERTLESGQVDYYKNPVGQIIEITNLLQDYFEINNINLPIYRVVLFKEANRSLQFDETDTPIMCLQQLPHFIRTRPREHLKLEAKRMDSLISNLLDQHRVYNPFPITTKYFIDPKDIMTGVCCETCKLLAVRKQYRGWKCQNCGESTKTAHLYALTDYAMLISLNIGNNECRRFLQLDTCKQASAILKRINVDSSGSKKKREYLLNYKMEKK